MRVRKGECVYTLGKFGVTGWDRQEFQRKQREEKRKIETEREQEQRRKDPPGGELSDRLLHTSRPTSTTMLGLWILFLSFKVVLDVLSDITESSLAYLSFNYKLNPVL